MLTLAVISGCPDRSAEPQPGELRLSEVASSNVEDGAPASCDEAGECEDWIEVENLTDRPLELQGVWLSDRLDTPFAHQLSRSASIPVPPRGRAILFADAEPAEGPRHLPFKLSKAGESLLLSTPTGTRLDALTLPPLTRGQSYARVGEAWVVCESPTPGAANACAAPAPRLRD